MMKTPKQYLTKLGMFLVLIISLYSCNNDDDNRPPIDQLPEATQTGRGIFGALVDGEAFVETNNFFNTFYQQVDGEFFFGIQGEVDDRDPRSIGVGTNALELQEGTTIILTDNVPGNAWGGVFFNPETNVFESVETNSQNQGTLTITKLDFENNIVSGTFEMTVEDPFTGELVQITEGRFDTLFTQ